MLSVFVIIILGITLQHKYIKEFPSHIHAWSQSDHYALALGFERNNLNFFLPETFTMNRQFPNNFEVPSNNGITSVDFPIHDYIPALIMKMTGSKDPWIFRTYILLYSFVGLFFLFRLSGLFFKETWKSLLVIIFAATSPLFTYYQGSFLPSIPSLANVFIGLYFYFSFREDQQIKKFYWAILFLTLAALSRTTFIIPLVACISLELFDFTFQKRRVLNLKKITSFSLGFVFIIGYYLYNNYLRHKYGSIFLNSLKPVGSLNELKEIWQIIKDRWIWDYFSKAHYLILGISIAFALFFSFIKKKENSSLALFIGINLAGCIMFAGAMTQQFTDHDYYFLDTFFLPVVLLFLWSLSLIPKLNFRYSTAVLSSFALLISIPLITNAINRQESRRVSNTDDRVESTINNYQESEQLLMSLKIKEDAKILVIDAYAPNIPLTLMNRMGYAIMTTSKENIEKALSWDYDFISIQNEFYVSDIYNYYPDIEKRIEKIGDNGRISIWKLKK